MAVEPVDVVKSGTFDVFNIAPEPLTMDEFESSKHYRHS